MRKLRLGEVKKLTQNHTAIKWRSIHSNSGDLPSEFLLHSPFLHPPALIFCCVFRDSFACFSLPYEQVSSLEQELCCLVPSSWAHKEGSWQWLSSNLLLGRSNQIAIKTLAFRGGRCFLSHWLKNMKGDQRGQLPTSKLSRS
jgi:hypothetical protein